MSTFTICLNSWFKFLYVFLFITDELGYLVDAIVNEDKIDSFDSKPNNLSLEVTESLLLFFCHNEVDIRYDNRCRFALLFIGQAPFIKITTFIKS